ncbi:hypothetical protein MAM1_0020d01747 [Mucor ambiguus]|uniref:Uncharacterized protein n=1 Tax=Mucor ambiguus TaxID=91626 RepID=A0A0C9M6F5_9FUNG|nr:hypothetical protein MAM1_0020d01747 [Mucor ambiguus]
MNGIDPPNSQQIATNSSCLLAPEIQPFEPQAEDILTDEDLLDLFRIVKQVLRKNPDSEKLAKLLFCMSYALGDHIKFSKPCHEDRIVFRDNQSAVHSVRLPSTSSCCVNTSSSSHHNHHHRASTSTATFSLNHPLNDSASSMTRPDKDSVQKWIDSSSVTSTASPSPISPLIRLPSVSYLTNNQPITSATPTTTAPTNTTNLSEISNDNTSTDAYSVRPYTNFRPLYSTSASPGANHTSSPTITSSTAAVTAAMHSPSANRHSPSIPSPSASHHVSQHHQQSAVEVSDLSMSHHDASSNGTSERYHQSTSNTIQHPASTEVVMEPQQRGFYYQDGRIAREPVLLQRYAEQGILTQASLMRKRKRQSADANSPYEVSNLPVPTKKPKIPHRHGEFEQRRDDIINRMRSITMADLEQKAQRLPNQFTLAIDESVTLAENNLSATVSNGSMSQEQLVELLEPALRILTNHSNMKPHLDNGMNQNGIYYNSDYFRLYLAFEQFQRTFAILFPNEVMKVPETAGAGNADSDNTSSTTTTAAAAAAAAERDKDRERNANMKAYRVWIEPLLTETNWAAFRRNIVVGERMMQLTKLVGQGVLLMTKELSGSKLHLTFTNSEWDEFINGLQSGRWDQTIEWENGQKKQFGNTKSLLVSELQLKFATHFWFYPDGSMVSSKERRLVIHASTVTNNNTNNTLLLHRNSMGDPSSLMHTHHQQHQQQQQQQHLHTHH